MSSKISPGKRFDILKRDGFRCRYCGSSPPESKLEVDHITPLSAGGIDNDNNLAAACFACNRGKYNKVVEFPDMERRHIEQAALRFHDLFYPLHLHPLFVNTIMSFFAQEFAPECGFIMVEVMSRVCLQGNPTPEEAIENFVSECMAELKATGKGYLCYGNDRVD